MSNSNNHEGEHLITFYLRNQLFAIDLVAVEEVVLIPEITPLGVPPSPSEGAIRGIFNLRGTIVPTIDLKERIGLPTCPYPLSAKVIITRSGDTLFGLIVDAVGAVVRLSPGALASTPDVSYGIPRRYLKGVAKLAEGLMLVLDVDALLGPLQRSLGTEGNAGENTVTQFAASPHPSSRQED